MITPSDTVLRETEWESESSFVATGTVAVRMSGSLRRQVDECRRLATSKRSSANVAAIPGRRSDAIPY
jgi:hypothetical protein